MPCVRAKVIEHLDDAIRVATRTAIPAVRILRPENKRSISPSGEIEGSALDESLPGRDSIVRLVFDGLRVFWDMEVKTT